MILVTCANGKLGKRIIDRLLKDENCPAIRAGARTVARIEKMLAARCTLLKVDFDDRASLDTAFKRVSTLVFVSGNAGNAIRIPQHHTVIEAAKAAGVNRIVYTSFANPTPASAFKLVQAHVETERMLKESGIAHTILRNTLYAANIDGFVAGAIANNVLALPSAAAKIAYATHDDLAEAIAKVVLESGHGGKIYELTGPEAVDADAIAQQLSASLNRPVAAADFPLDAFAAHLVTLGFDADGADDLVSIYRAAAAGEYSTVHGDLETLIRRKPVSVGDYIAGLAAGAK
jgi:NAD(P)H dehydrogenase (quinone)